MRDQATRCPILVECWHLGVTQDTPHFVAVGAVLQEQDILRRLGAIQREGLADAPLTSAVLVVKFDTSLNKTVESVNEMDAAHQQK